MLDIECYYKSIALLKEASTAAGFVAAVNGQDNYERIWTRDGVVCSIAALMSGDKTLIRTARATIETIFSHQHETGNVPSNVTPSTGKVSYGGSVGRADNPSWAVIGVCVYAIFTGDRNFAITYKAQVSKCLALLDAWEFNGKHLLYVPQSGDWADEYIHHGYVLFPQLLRVWALRLAARIFPNGIWEKKAEAITGVIMKNYWKGSRKAGELYLPNLKNMMQKVSDEYWMMGFNPSRVYSYFDLQANSLALLLRIGSLEQDAAVNDWMEHLYRPKGQMLPSFFPVIREGDADMSELKNNYAYSFRNKPGQFHNGALWPVWNGLAVMGLVNAGNRGLAQNLTEAIHKANARQQSPFNECLDGYLNEPCGIAKCSWSAAGAIIAEQSLNGNILL